ncbi:hypothetical protein [Streptomyces sp. ISL-11]|uniref:hypothetical protein n=1 Tax=Streptomyces sp. ISL-11 TaxID=2819174 RepID=UPI001BEC1EE4|nr:hypothetical protein [Streptomyces sp. ISL-11]MBT2382666.1 hypothetical protein [Streptomyces sp. ISL-11]
MDITRLSHVEPDNGYPDQAVKIRGENLVDPRCVYFGDAQALDCELSEDGTFVDVTVPEIHGPVMVTVEDHDGNVSNAVAFTAL